MNRPRRNDITAFAWLSATSLSSAALMAVTAATVWSDGAQTHIVGMILAVCRGGQHLLAGTAGLVLFGAIISSVIVFALTTLAGIARTRFVVRRLLATRTRVDPATTTAAVAAQLAGRLDVCNDDTAVVFTYGLIRPRVLLTTGALRLLSAAQLTSVLAHEAHHARRRDPLRTLVCGTLSRTLFLFPLIGELGRHFLTESELVADAAAIRATNRETTAAAILKFLEAPRFRLLPGVAPGACTNSRIAQLLAPDSFTHRFVPSWTSIALTSACVALGSILLDLVSHIPSMAV